MTPRRSRSPRAVNGRSRPTPHPDPGGGRGQRRTWLLGSARLEEPLLAARAGRGSAGAPSGLASPGGKAKAQRVAAAADESRRPLRPCFPPGGDPAPPLSAVPAPPRWCVPTGHQGAMCPRPSSGTAAALAERRTRLPALRELRGPRPRLRGPLSSSSAHLPAVRSGLQERWGPARWVLGSGVGGVRRATRRPPPRCAQSHGPFPPRVATDGEKPDCHV